MTPRKLNIHFALFAYGGTGNIAMCLPSHVFWWAETFLKMTQDKRIGEITAKDYSDTPIPMMRNRAAENAKKLGADLLLFLDSDNKPDVKPTGKPFWDTSFDFIYERWEQGPRLVFAPYCGPPPCEDPYVFKWQSWENDAPLERYKLAMMSREEAALYAGFVDVPAGPTGLMLIDMRLFELLTHPYFDYGYTDKARSQKGCTEDVYFTRNLSLAGMETLGYNPVFCNFDSWAGHAKVKMVMPPNPVTCAEINDSLRQAVLLNRPKNERQIMVENAVSPNGHGELRITKQPA